LNLRKSRFIHQLPLGADRVLIVHALSQVRLTVDRHVSAVVDYFAVERTLPADYAGLAELVPIETPALEGCVNSLCQRGILTDKNEDDELAEVTAKLGATYGRDPLELLDKYRRGLKEGAEAYWSAGAAYGLADLQGAKRRVDVVLFGDCDIQMEADFLRREAGRRGLDLRVATAFPDDFRFVSEHQHDAVIIGALRSRHSLTAANVDPNTAAHAGYIAEASHILECLRQRTAAPILLDNLPEPTVQPLGLAERGLSGHRNRFRLANVVLANLVESYADVHIVDLTAAHGAAGSEQMLDDGLFGFTHLGSPGWLLQRPESEKAAVHGLFPDVTPLAGALGGDPYGREKIMARAHVDALTVVLGFGRKKCVIVDLDGVLWPGVLAETGSPFAWDAAVSGTFSYVGLYFGLHEALLCLKRRGIVLACVSKNDEATVRELWKYPDHYPKSRLLTPDDFVTWRVNWSDKVENIRSIADELGFALDTFLFIDDHPVERDRVRQRLSDVEVWGENPFDLRRKLLNDPRLQLPRITEESASRTDLVKAQLNRQHLRAGGMSEGDYVASLQIQCRIGQVSDEKAAQENKLDRISELFQRTTQFNTNGRRFTVAELKALIGDSRAHVFSIEVADRFGDQGLVGAAVVEGGEIVGLVLSCRVLGLGVEHTFLKHVIERLQADYGTISARIVETARNSPVRNIYRDHGFSRQADGQWRLEFDCEPSRVDSNYAVA
jgi:FkbH-like protein